MSHIKGKGRPLLAILTNLVAPYRVPIYKALAEHFHVRIFVASNERNRAIWETQPLPSGLNIKRSWGFTIGVRHRIDASTWNLRYIHVTPGYFVDLLRYRPDAIITTEMGFRTILALSYRALTKTPVWVWWGGTLHTERGRVLVKRLVRRFLAHAVPRWISYGRTSTAYLCSLGVPRDRILQIQNCVDEALFSVEVPPLLNLHPKSVLLYVGQMIARKGVKQLLEAAASIQREGFQFSLLLVGDGPESEYLKRYADELGLTCVHFLPSQPYDVLPAVYRSADCLVFPTLEDVWGLVVNEALWSGIPVACSIYAGCAEELVPEPNRFDPLNHEDFVRILRMGVNRELVPPDTSRLLPSAVVAQMIQDDIVRVLAQ
jgi:glycosyltransferase involved in cell wall biosynthesis